MISPPKRQGIDPHGSLLEPLWNLFRETNFSLDGRRKESGKFSASCVVGAQGLRTLDPLIKSCRVPFSANFDAPRRISIRYWFDDAIRCELNHCTTIIFTRFHLLMLTLRFPGRLRSIPWQSKN